MTKNVNSVKLKERRTLLPKKKLTSSYQRGGGKETQLGGTKAYYS